MIFAPSCVPIGVRNRGLTGQTVEGQLHDFFGRPAVLLCGLDDLREQVVDAQLRRLLDTRVDGSLDGLTSRAARNHGGRRFGGVSRSLGHDR
ncbi:hypothetical protein AB0467_22580 [Streptomyces sp. NPDC052095]|uniref:hypothetical protein n=1 Tax=unclassified Streptomyces TaxID=2593676 RepID=UPI00344FF728